MGGKEPADLGGLLATGDMVLFGTGLRPRVMSKSVALPKSWFVLCPWFLLSQTMRVGWHIVGPDTH